MFALTPSVDPYQEKFIENSNEVVEALANIHGSLTTQLIREVMIASNSKTQHFGDYSSKNSLIISWQYNIVHFLREKLVALGWSMIDGTGGVAYILSPCKSHAIRVFSGNKYVGVKGGAVSNNASKGKTLKDDIYSPKLSFEDNTQIWILLFHKVNDVIRIELSQPKSFKKGKVVDWDIRIKLPDFRYNVPDQPLKKVEKVEVGTVPVRRKKA